MSATSNISLRQVEAFLEIARQRSFTKAAARLHVSAPYLSQTIKQLERSLGCTLLIRTTRSVELTSAGGVFAGLAERAMTELDRAVLAARNMSSRVETTIKLGYLIGAGLDLVPALLRTFAVEHPGTAIQTTEFDFAEPAAGLRDKQVHAAIIRPPVGLAGLLTVDLASEPRVACLPDGHELASRQSVSVADLLPEPIIAAPSSVGPWRDYWILTEYRSSPAPVVAEAATFEAELHLVASGQGISITAMAAARYYARPGIAFVPISDLDPCQVVLAWWPEDTATVADLVTVATALTRGEPQVRAPSSSQVHDARTSLATAASPATSAVS
jgi:DNA-binding transcriptional LysR family regulator